jgi:aminobenzoyl-glutamate transport protein
MLPYSLLFLVGWTVLLLAWWFLGLPLGLGASYTWPR